MSDCLFCKIIDGSIPSKKAYEDDRAFAFHDIHPQAPTHVLIIPKKHIAQVSLMAADDKELIGHIHWVAGQLAKQLGLTDFRLVTNNGAEAGQTVFHVHFHLLAGRPLQWPPG